MADLGLPNYKLPGYVPKEYWKARFEFFDIKDPRGVGHSGHSEARNNREYEEASKTLLKFFPEDLSGISVLDIGCGNGIFTRALKFAGCEKYTGLDITDVYHAKLKKEFRGYTFIKGDICDPLFPKSHDEKYDFIIMLDVTQHIINMARFSVAMQNVKGMLDGKFIVTSWLMDEMPLGNMPHEKPKTIEDFSREWQGYSISIPEKFKDKWILCISSAQ